jgi:hypothetical protein
MASKVKDMNSSSEWKIKKKNSENYFNFNNRKIEKHYEKKEKENHFLLFCSSTR